MFYEWSGNINLDQLNIINLILKKGISNEYKKINIGYKLILNNKFSYFKINDLLNLTNNISNCLKFSYLFHKNPNKLYNKILKYIIK